MRPGAKRKAVLTKKMGPCRLSESCGLGRYSNVSSGTAVSGRLLRSLLADNLEEQRDRLHSKLQVDGMEAPPEVGKPGVNAGLTPVTQRGTAGRQRATRSGDRYSVSAHFVARAGWQLCEMLGLDTFRRRQHRTRNLFHIQSAGQ